MKKIVLILPYYGKFPGCFQLFLRSCKNNPTIDWIIFTDEEIAYKIPKNVHFVKLTFNELKAKIQSKFDFCISLENAYKLCDYKPAYGLIFEEYLAGYDYWGYCDCDLLFGDLRSFLPDERLNQYDKIGHLGHLTLYRNTYTVNRVFMFGKDGKQRYKDVYSTPHICVFDEWNDLSINQLFLRQEKRLDFFDDILDIYPYDDNFKLVKYDDDLLKRGIVKNTISKHFIYATWENGKIYSVFLKNGIWVKEEAAYAHFQKRNMTILCDEGTESILCIPDYFTDLSEEISDKIVWKSRLHMIFNTKRMRQIYLEKRYWFIEKTGPLRHKIRNKNFL